MNIKAVCTHVTRGRIRMRLPDRLSESGMRDLSERLLDLPKTSSVRYSALTGSIVLHHDSLSTAEYLDEICQTGELLLLNKDDQGALMQTRSAVTPALNALDQRIRDLTGGETGLRGAGATVFTLLGLFQIVRGQGLPAGLTLMINASKFMRTEHQK